MIALISKDPSFGNCVGLYHALSLKDDVQAVFKEKDEKGFYKEIPYYIGYHKIPRDADQYVIVSAEAFMDTRDIIEEAMVILTDSYYLKHYELVNENLNGHVVYCMPDLMKYTDRECRTYYPPYEYDGEIVKNDKLTIAHSPYSDHKKILKGTQHIHDAFEDISHDVDFEYDIIMNAKWDESIKRKAKAHIFIDQLTDRGNGYNGALAKSGIEAMATECMTFTSGDNKHNKQIPLPPVEWIDFDNICDKLLFYINNDAKREERIIEQKQWVDEYLNYQFQSDYLLS